MINIVHFIHGLSIGGAENLVKEYALKLDKTKFNLTVLCLEKHYSAYEKLLEENKISIIYVCEKMPLYKRNDIFSRVINKLQRYYYVRKILKELSPDILHTHLTLNDLIKFAKLPKNTKIFYTQHFDAERYKKDYPKDVAALKWLIHHYPTQLIALHDSMRKQLNKMFGIHNTTILNNGIDLSRFKAVKTKEQIRQDLGIPQNAFVLGHIGRLTAIKNQSFLIDIAAKILKQKSNIWLLLIGDGEDRTKLEQKIINCGLQKNYLILSNRTDIPDLLTAMDCFILPSVSEGIPISLIEAQVAGLPCIVSDTVPQDISISNLVTFKSLKAPIQEWIKSILKIPPTPKYTNLEEWDLAKIIRKLEKLYEK